MVPVGPPLVDSDGDSEGDGDSEDEGDSNNAAVAHIATQRMCCEPIARATAAPRFAIVMPSRAVSGSKAGVAARSGGNSAGSPVGTVDVHQRLATVERDLEEARLAIGQAVWGIGALRGEMSQTAVSREEERRKAWKGKGKAK